LKAIKPEIEKLSKELDELIKKQDEYAKEVKEKYAEIQRLIEEETKKRDRVREKIDDALDKYPKLSYKDKDYRQKRKVIDEQIEALSVEGDKVTAEVNRLWELSHKAQKASFSSNNPFNSQVIDLKERQGILEEPYEDLKYDAYRILAGEVESRDVGLRADMTLAERREVEPYSLEGFKEDEVIVSFDNTAKVISKDRSKIERTTDPRPKETYQSFAVKLKDGKIVTGRSHTEAVKDVPLDKLDGAVDGMITSEGKFTTRPIDK
ncbi:unnamed protein product, partial [marine sediment metagenome]